jgi:hypothetical protein
LQLLFELLQLLLQLLPLVLSLAERDTHRTRVI